MNTNKLEINLNNEINYKYFLLTFDDNYVNVGIGLVKSILANTNEKVCFIVFTDKFNDTNLEKIKDTKVPFIIYYIDKTLFNYDLNIHKSWPITTMFRLIAPWVIEEKMDYLYYLDADMICVNKIDDLFDIKFTESIAICPEISANATKVCNKFGSDLVYCNAGFLIYNMISIKEKYTMNKMLEDLNGILDDLSFGDQDFLNLYYKNDCLHLNPFKYNNHIYDFYNKYCVKQFLSNAIFVHFCVVKGKPWNTNSTLTRYNIYLKYSKDPYMSKVVSKCKRVYLFKAPFYKLYSLCYKIARKVYKTVFRRNNRITHTGGVTLNLEFNYYPTFRLPSLMEVI